MENYTIDTELKEQENNKIASFFQDLEQIRSYFKIGLEGFAGSGKTFTGARIAAGLHNKIKSDKPIIIFDTETSSKFLARFFKELNIPVKVKISRSLSDLVETMKLCQNGASDILIIDSITHLWEDFTEAYKKKKNRQRLQFQDWGILKPAWKKNFSDTFVNSKIHIIMTGRAGYDYDFEQDDDGRKELIKTGIKMKAETETAYEPDVLVYMERVESLLGDKKNIYRQATILKDRSDLMDGKEIKNPSFQDFEPIIDDLLKGKDEPEHTQSDAGNLIQDEEDRREWIKKRDIALEKIENTLIQAYGAGVSGKKEKIYALESCFGTNSWEEIKTFKPEKIEEGLEKIKMHVIEFKKSEKAGK